MKAFSKLAGACAALLALAMPAVVQAQTAPATAPVTAPAPAAVAGEQGPVLKDGYIVGVGDSLDVVLVGGDEYRARVMVQADGTIELPYINTVVAKDKNLLQLGREIAQKLEAGGYYVKPAIQVTVASIASSYVTVLGAVGSPGLIPLDRDYRASEIIARVGGIKPGGSETFYLRREDGKEIELAMATIARGGDAADPLVAPGDKIFVPDAPTYYIYGQVNSPGIFPMMGGTMSLRMALARGGGLTSLGSDKRISVIRNGVEMKKVDLNQPVMKDDVIVVGERFF